MTPALKMDVGTWPFLKKEDNYISTSLNMCPFDFTTVAVLFSCFPLYEYVVGIGHFYRTESLFS